MQLENVSKRNLKIKMAVQGESATGKTISALMIAYGLVHDWQKIAIIDAERGASMYAHLGNYKIVPLKAPFSPEQLIAAIDLCQQHQIEVIIIDSLSLFWSGSGGILDIHAAMKGKNSYTDWLKVMPRYNASVEKILQAEVHIIATIRTKPHYELTEHNGKQIPVKNGFKAICHHAMPYEFSLLLTLNQQYHAVAVKDRTGIIKNKAPFIPNEQIGQALIRWCQQDSIEELQKQIKAAQNEQELLALYNSYPAFQEPLRAEFARRQQELSLILKTTQNGTLNTN